MKGPASRRTWRTLAAPCATRREGSSAVSSAAERSQPGLRASVSPGALRDDLTAVAGCVMQAFPAAVASGVLDKVTVSKLAAVFGQVKNASLLADGIALAGGVTWRIGDL